MSYRLKNFQLIILILILFNLFFSITRLLLNPNLAKKQVSQYSFPDQILLPEAQLIKSINSPNKIDYEVVIANQKYLYQINNNNLEINNFYVVGTRGTYHGLIKLEDVLNYDKNKQDFLLSMKTKNNLNYALFVQNNTTYLVSCINPRGGSSVTSDQFMKNRYQNDLNLSRFFTWLKGEESSIDLRCLWSIFSLPINDHNSVEANYQLLENVWFSWYDYWQNNFPKSS